MSLLNAYNQILNENKKEHEVKGSVKVGQDLASGFKVNKQEGPKVDSPKEDKEHSVDGKNNGEAKKLKEATNPFDAIYNKILAQENWEAEEEANEQPDFGGGAAPDLEFSGDHSTGEGEIDLHDETDEDPMKQVLSALRSAVEALEKVVGGDESEEEEEEEEEPGEETEEDEEDESANEGPQEFGESAEGDEEDEEEENDKDVVEDDVDAEVLGHALIDLEKLAANLSSPKSQVVKGAVPVSKGKAQAPKGSKTNAQPTELKGKGENLQSKKNDTGLVKKDKNWYDQ
jgi:hypothetical protein